MKSLKPYWFLEKPIDKEHKFYILMDYLQSIENDFNVKEYVKPLTNILRIQKDLWSFKNKGTLSVRSNSNLTKTELEKTNAFIEEFNRAKEGDDVIETSLSTIEEFLGKHDEIIREYDRLVEVTHSSSINQTWDRGFLVIRKAKNKSIRIFSWHFSIIKIDGNENVALLMTELLEPICDFTEDNREIKKFLIQNLKPSVVSPTDAVLFAEIFPDLDWESGIDLAKEKAVDSIVKNYKKSIDLL
jgi:hypothetical protein